MGEKQPFFGLATSSKGKRGRHHESTIPLVHPPAEVDEFAAVVGVFREKFLRQ
jgi:hypothetical protein